MKKYDRTPWWEIEESADVVSQLVSWVDNFDNYQSGRTEELFRFMSLYANRDMLSMGRSGSSTYNRAMPRQIINRTKALIDTLVARQVENETKATFNVSDGDFEDHDKAEKLEKFVWGEMYRTNAYELLRAALRDAAMVGDGYVFGGASGGKAYLERVMPLEIVWDDMSCVSGEPTEMYRRRWVTRQYALRRWPDKAEEIALLPTTTPPYFWPATDSDMVAVYEGWHLPDEDGKGGRHVIGCGNICILDEEWKRIRFPFIRMRWCDTPVGAYSLGLVEELLDLQMELDLVTRRLQHSIRLFVTPRVWQQAGTKVSSEYNNMMGNVYKYSGQKPEVDSGATGLPAVLFERERQLVELIDAQAGVSAMELTGDVPSHTDSRPALREVQEIASGRRAWISRRFQDACAKQAATLLIDTAREIVKDRGSYKTFGKARSFVEQIDFKDCNLEDDRFEIQIQPTSYLPQSVPGKRMVANEMMQSGLISDPEDIWEMMAGMPDIDAMRSRKTASRKLAEKQISSIKSKQIYMAPDINQNIMMAKALAVEEINLLRTMHNVPDKVFELLNQYIFECDQIDQILNPPPPPAPPMPPQAPMGVPPQGVVPNGPPVPAPPGAPGMVGPVPVR